VALTGWAVTAGEVLAGSLVPEELVLELPVRFIALQPLSTRARKGVQAKVKRDA
jgi:hypothetical protein